MDSLLLVLGAAKRRGSSASWGAHPWDSPMGCLLRSCLRASVGRNCCSCPAPTCAPQSQPTNPFLLLWLLTAGLPVPNSLSCPLCGWEQELHLPWDVPLGSAGPLGGRAEIVSSPKLGSTRTFLKQVKSRADRVNVNYIPLPLTEVYRQSLSQRKCPQRSGHIQAIRFVDPTCSREREKWSHMWKLSRRRPDLATDTHWKWNNTWPNSQLRVWSKFLQHSFVFKDIHGASFPSTAMHGIPPWAKEGGQQQKEWMSKSSVKG